MLLSQGILLVASSPILSSSTEGPSQGTLLVGRYLDATHLRFLEKLTNLDSIQIHRLDRPGLPPNAAIALAKLQQGQSVVVTPQNASTISGFALGEDLMHGTGFLFQITISRTIYQQGLISLGYLGLFAFSLAVVLGGVIWVLSQKLLHYIAERDRVQQALFYEKELAQLTLHSIGDGVITTDAQGYVQSLNAVAEKLTGWQAHEAQGKPFAEVYQVVDEETLTPIENPVEISLHQHRKPIASQSILLLARNGEKYAVDHSIAPIRLTDGKLVGVVLVFRDATQARYLERQLSWQASCDALTGLVNRRKFEQCLQQALASARIDHQQHCLCFIDLDHFKPINDTCGHMAGDDVLRQVSRLLESTVRKTDVVARLGGDEFAILLHQCPFAQGHYLAQTICDAIQAFRFIWHDHQFMLGASIGLVMVQAESPSLEAVLHAADVACYAAKRAGRGQVQLYHPDLDMALETFPAPIEPGAMSQREENLQRMGSHS